MILFIWQMKQPKYYLLPDDTDPDHPLAAHFSALSELNGLHLSSKRTKNLKNMSSDSQFFAAAFILRVLRHGELSKYETSLKQLSEKQQITKVFVVSTDEGVKSMEFYFANEG